MNPVFLSDSVFLHFGTSSATTGAATNADSTPTVTVAEDGVDMGYAPSVTNIATGLYMVTIVVTAGNGFEAGKRYSAYVTATVGGIAGRDGLDEFEVLAVDLNTGVASVTGAVGSVTGLTAANLDVTVSSRLASAAYTAPDNASITTILSDTNDIQTRLPAALVGGRMDSDVGAIQANAITAASLAADAVNEIVAGVFANVTDGTLTFAQAQRLMASSILAILSGAVSGGTGTVTVRDVADTKDRFTWGYDANGNRTALTIIDTAA